MQNRARADEADAGDDLRRDPRAVGLHARELFGQNREHRRAETDKHIGAQSGRLVAQLTLKTDNAAERHCQQQPRQRRTQHNAQFVTQQVYDLMNRIHSSVLASSGFYHRYPALLELHPRNG